jgi:hypothetical protein
MLPDDLDRGWLSHIDAFEHDEPTRKRRLDATTKLNTVQTDARVVSGYLALEESRTFDGLSSEEQEQLANSLFGRASHR